MSKQAVVFGAFGGIGLAVVNELLKRGYSVNPISSANVDFADSESKEQIIDILNNKDPDVVVNCAGIFGDNNVDYHKLMDINVASNWHIIKHYLDYNKKAVKLIFIGSSAYKRGKKNYMLYSASKAALHNLVEGAKDFFASTKTTVNIIHPVRTRTKMVEPFSDTLDYLKPEDVADEVGRCLDENFSYSIDINFKDNNENRFIRQGNSRESSL